jgi:hypothetical protein
MGIESSHARDGVSTGEGPSPVERYDYGRHVRGVVATFLFWGGIASMAAGFAFGGFETLESVAAGALLLVVGLLQRFAFWRLFIKWFW